MPRTKQSTRICTEQDFKQENERAQQRADNEFKRKGRYPSKMDYYVRSIEGIDRWRVRVYWETANSNMYREPSIQGWRSLHNIRKDIIKQAKANPGVRQMIFGGVRKHILALEQAKKVVNMSFIPLYDPKGYCIVNAVMNAGMSLGVESFDVQYTRKTYKAYNDVDVVKNAMNNDPKVPVHVVKVPSEAGKSFIDILRSKHDGVFVVMVSGHCWTWVTDVTGAYIIDPADGSAYGTDDEALAGPRVRFMQNSRVMVSRILQVQKKNAKKSK